MLLFCLKISKKITLTAGSGLRFFYFSKTRILDDYKQKSKSYSSKKSFLEE